MRLEGEGGLVPHLLQALTHNQYLIIITYLSPCRNSKGCAIPLSEDTLDIQLPDPYPTPVRQAPA